jgi:hypothetical protein
MSFSASVPPPINGIRSIFSAGSLGAAAKYAGAAAVGGVVAATYQIAYEEGRTMVQGLRAKSLARRQHNDMIMCALLQTELPLPALAELRKSRDLMREVIDRSVDPKIPGEVREVLRRTLKGLMVQTTQA